MILNNRRILIVEDTPQYQRHAFLLVESWGMKASLAWDGLEALEVLSKIDVDICLMDIQMPRMDGFDTALHIRSQLRRKFPIIAATALDPSAREECIQCGMDDYIQKPYQDLALKKMLSDWMHIYKSQHNFSDGIS